MNDRQSRISLRRDSQGGGKLSKLEGTEEAFQPRERFVLLVHGYNVSRKKAEGVYRRFTDMLVRMAPALETQIVFVHWPGDGPPVVSTFWYVRRVRTANECAADLANYIEKRFDDRGVFPEIVVVAHSLGCRLMIKALQCLSEERQRAVKLITMAAAYPVSLVWNSQALMRNRPAVLYSGADWVLRRTFPFAQSIAQDSGSGWPEAVGLEGRPVGGIWSRRAEMAGYGHGKYWTSSHVAAIVCAALNFPVGVPLPTHDLPTQSSLDRGLPERDLPER